jgi:hypothetical protein
VRRGKETETPTEVADPQGATSDHTLAGDAAKMQKDIALADSALACVRDDGSIDLGRLLLIEYEHNLDRLRAVVVKAGRRLDKRKHDPSYGCDPDIRQMELSFLSKMESVAWCATSTATIARHDRALWSVRPDGRRMTDTEMAGWMAICARHCAFSFLYDAFVKGCEPQRRGYIDYEGMPCFKHMWLASVARGLAGWTNTWTGANVICTRSLCIALTAILDARLEGGPLAVVDTPMGGKLDQAVASSPATIQEGDQQLMASMQRALQQVRYVKQQLGFTFLVGHAEYDRPNAKYAADHTRALLYTVYCAIHRLYATGLGCFVPVDPDEATAKHDTVADPAKITVAPVTATEIAGDATEDKRLADAALACVRWDESVDVGRLLLLEHEHDLYLLGRAVAKAGARLDEYDPSRSSEFVTSMRAVDLHLFSTADGARPESRAVLIDRHDGALWSIGSGDRRLTDAQVASWMALCARHCSFMLEYNVRASTDDKDNRQPDRGDNVEFEVHESMWLASVARGLADRAGAWTGIEIIRMRNLCLVLLAILAAREKRGPLAVVDLPTGNRLDQAIMPVPCAQREGNDALLMSISEALDQAERVRQLGFAFFDGYTTYRYLNEIDSADHTRQMLSIVYASVERLYATESYYVGLIVPAEYEAIVNNTAGGAIFLH